MAKKLLIQSAICILAIALLVILLSPKTNDETNSSGSSPEKTHTNVSTDSRSPAEIDIRTKRDREDPEAALALREMEREFDRLLPALFPKQNTSLCDTTLEPGDTLVLGGFRRSDGNYEFTMLEAEPLGVDGAPFQKEGDAPQYKITTKFLLMSREKSSEIGLDSLISPAKIRIQKSIVFPVGKTPSLDASIHIMSMPHIVTRPDTAASMSIIQEDQGYLMSMIVSPKDASKSLRIRTRVESPSELISPTKPSIPKN